MPINQLLTRHHSFAPDDIAVLASAYEDAVVELGLVAGNNAARLTLARKIIDLAKDGERDASILREMAIKSLSG